MKSKKTLIVVIFGVLLIAAGLASLSIVKYNQGFKQFIADGYILKPSAEVNAEEAQVSEQYYFTQGANYRERFASKILFKDTSDQKVSIDTVQFTHYSGGTLGAFTKGVILDLKNIEEDQFGYYSLTKNTVLVKNGSVYEMSSHGESMNMEEFVWKISDTDYMIVSPEVTLALGNDLEVTLPDYAQIKYVDNGIVRVAHQQGVYQSVSTEAKITTQRGAELNLSNKNFYVDGEPSVSLDAIALNDDSYVELDENTDTPSLKIPEFVVQNGKDGASGLDGASGFSGAAGYSGFEGEAGSSGGSGNEGEEGAEGLEGRMGDEGKEGKTGTEGEKGEEGSEGGRGEEGSRGDQGREGLEGAAANEGLDGVQGIDGDDGLEGNSGIMGYDGANGRDGERDNQTDTLPVDLNARPTVELDSASYDITPGSVEMKLKLTDSDTALNPGTVQVKIFDRATMQQVNTDAEALEWGRELESSSDGIVIKKGNLAPGTEYLVVVSGEYASESENGKYYQADLFTKVFKTDELGVVLNKGVVTDTTICLNTAVTSAAIGKYDVELYYFDEGGTKIIVGTYTNLEGNQDEILFDYVADKPTGVTPIYGNKQYYAKLSNVTLAGTTQTLDGLADTELKIMTLKTKPYHESEDATGAKIKTSITNMQPKLVVNQRNHTLTITMDSVEDPHVGVIGWKYELYEEESVKGKGGLLDGLVPAYAAEADTLHAQTFNIMTDATYKGNYVARVVAIFDDNEKVVEYSTLLSAGERLAGNEFPVVTIAGANKNIAAGGRPDALEGYVVINDRAPLMPKNLRTEDQPLQITLSSEFEEDVHVVYVYDKDMVPHLAGTTDIPDTSGSTSYYYFYFDNLKKDSTYTLTVHGPVDLNGDNTWDESERRTYLYGTPNKTTDTLSLMAVFTDVPDAAVAFSKRLNFTALATTMTTTVKKPQASQTDDKINYIDVDVTETVPVSFFEYEAQIMDTVTLELVHRFSDGTEKVMGEHIITDPDLINNPAGNKSLNHSSDFYSGGWVNYTETSIIKKELSDDEKNSENLPDGYNIKFLSTTTPNEGFEGLVLTPKDFLVDDNDNEFHSGGLFIIRVKQANDYTTKHKNVIYFDPVYNQIIFKLEKKHSQAKTPNRQVTVNNIENDSSIAAADSKKNTALDKDTVVGITVQAAFQAGDAKNITYTLYKLNPDALVEIDADNKITLKDESKINYYSDIDIKDENSTLYKDVLAIERELNPGRDDAWIKANVIPNKYRYIGDDAVEVGHFVEGSLSSNVGEGRAHTLKLYFNGDVYREDHKITEMVWVGGGAGPISRGDRYFVTYTAECMDKNDAGFDSYGYNCSTENYTGTPQKHQYPNCTYNAGTLVPYYRSAIFEINKQKPQVERYPWTSDSKSVTWRYRINDPDNAISTMPADTYTDAQGGLKKANKTELTVYEYKTLKDYQDYISGVITDPRSELQKVYINAADFKPSDSATLGFKDVKLGGGGIDFITDDTNYLFYDRKPNLTNERYYSVSMGYKLENRQGSVEEKIESIPVQYKTPWVEDADYSTTPTSTAKAAFTNTPSVTNVLIQGQKRTVASQKDYIKKNHSDSLTSDAFEDALVDQGGYRLRLTLRGENIKEIAALRVTFKDTSSKNRPDIVFDPVYLEFKDDELEDSVGGRRTPYAYAYLYTDGFASWRDTHNVLEGNADIKVEAYYSTRVVGVKSSDITVSPVNGYANIDPETVASTDPYGSGYDPKWTSFAGLNTYALQLMDEETAETKYYYYNKGFVASNTMGKNKEFYPTIGGSVFMPSFPYSTSVTVSGKTNPIPKTVGALDTLVGGFKVYTDDTLQAYNYTFKRLSQRYVAGPMVIDSAKGEEIPLDVTFDETGMKVGSRYVMPERLILRELDFHYGSSDSDPDNKINLSDIMPAVTKTGLSVGTSSIIFDMDIIGLGKINPDTGKPRLIYAQVKEEITSGSGGTFKTLDLEPVVQMRMIYDQTSRTTIAKPVRVLKAVTGTGRYVEDRTDLIGTPEEKLEAYFKQGNTHNNGKGVTSADDSPQNFGNDYWILDESYDTWENPINPKEPTTATIKKDNHKENHLTLRVQGLNKKTKYQIVIFTFNSKGEKTELYTIEGNSIGSPYEATTGELLNIVPDNVQYTYNKYAEKYATIGFSIPGDDGTDKKAYYWVTDANGNWIWKKSFDTIEGDSKYFVGGKPVLDTDNVPVFVKDGTTIKNSDILYYLEPLTAGSYSYYSQLVSENHRMTVNMFPQAGGNVLKLGTPYTMHVVVVNSEETDFMGYKAIPFTTPTILNRPSFYVQASPTINISEGTAALNLDITCRDSNRVIYNDIYTVSVRDLNGNLVGEEREVLLDEKSLTQGKSLTFTSQIQANQTYLVQIKAKVDRDNDNVADDDEVKEEIYVDTLPGAKAVVETSATSSELLFSLSSLQNFSDVKKMFVTVYANGEEVVSQEIPYDGKRSYYVTNWGEKANGAPHPVGTYTVRIQYRDEKGNFLGMNDATATVRGTSGFSKILSFFGIGNSKGIVIEDEGSVSQGDVGGAGIVAED